MEATSMTLSETEVKEQEERNAITELLFFASTGNVARMQTLIAFRGVAVKSPSCCDYDRRTPLHLAAAEGKTNAANWLLEQGCIPNPVDRFFRTPLEDALIGGHMEVQQLLLKHGGKVFRKGIGFVDCNSIDLTAWDDQSRGSASSADDVVQLRSRRASRDGLLSLSCHSSRSRILARRDSSLDFLQDSLQEHSPELRGLYLERLVGRGSFGRVYKAKWRSCTVAVKVLSHEGSQSARVNALHESVVSQHVSHPNVITTYKVHKVDLSGSAHSSLDERASRAMSGLSLCGLGGSRVALNPLSDSGGLETPRTLAAFAGASPKAFGDGTAFPVRHDSADDELTLDFTETGACILREASPAPERMDEHAVCGRSQSVSSLASPFAAAIDLARAGQLPSLPGLGPSPGSGPGTSLPPKPRGIERRAATDMLPNIHTGRDAQLANHGSLWPKPLDAALNKRCSSPPSDPDSHFSAFQVEGEVAETLILMEFADLGSLDHYAARTSFKGNLACCLLCLRDIALGMKYLHSLGLLHSDLKGANVLLKSAVPSPDDPRGLTCKAMKYLDSLGLLLSYLKGASMMLKSAVPSPDDPQELTCKIADFGMSRVLADDKTHVSTDTHGTVAYMAPEVLQTGNLSMAADVYSFAMIMLELWSGESVYKDFPAHQVLFKVFTGHKPEVPADMPAGYRALMEDCWDKDPTKRPTFKAILPRLQSLLAEAIGPMCGLHYHLP